MRWPMSYWSLSAIDGLTALMFGIHTAGQHTSLPESKHNLKAFSLSQHKLRMRHLDTFVNDWLVSAAARISRNMAYADTQMRGACACCHCMFQEVCLQA